MVLQKLTRPQKADVLDKHRNAKEEKDIKIFRMIPRTKGGQTHRQT
jgi:hypothetical protein